MDLVFLGTVSPELQMNVAISSPNPERVSFEFQSRLGRDEVVSHVRVEFVNPRLFVVLRNLPHAPLPEIRNVLQTYCQAFVDAMEFSQGGARTAFLDTSISSAGETVSYSFGARRPPEFKACDPSDILNIALDPRGFQVLAALADIRTAIQRPRDTAFFAYRAIESVKQHFVRSEEGRDKDAAWARMNSALQLDPSWARQVADLGAHEVRHGKFMAKVDGTDRDTAIEAARVVVNRFIFYLRGGEVPLSPDEFPKRRAAGSTRRA